MVAPTCVTAGCVAVVVICEGGDAVVRSLDLQKLVGGIVEVVLLNDRPAPVLPHLYPVSEVVVRIRLFSRNLNSKYTLCT